MKKSFKHLRQNDRDRIEALLNTGHTQSAIAGIPEVDESTISREIGRRKRKNGPYNATSAQQKAYLKRLLSKYQGMRVESDVRIRNYVIKQLEAHRSPDEIAGRMKLEKCSFAVGKDAIYRWLYSARGQRYCPYLCTKRYRFRKRKENRTKRVMIHDRVGIDERPMGAANKTRYRHFEADTAVAPKKADNTEAVALASERKSKFVVGTKINSLASHEMTGAMRSFRRRVNMISATADNGIENRDHKNWGTPAYFADPHSPWQKPLVENTIGLLRRWFFKKGTDWSGVTEEDLQHALSVLNNKYRKSLGYLSAIEVAMAHGIIKINSKTKSCI